MTSSLDFTRTGNFLQPGERKIRTSNLRVSYEFKVEFRCVITNTALINIRVLFKFLSLLYS